MCLKRANKPDSIQEFVHAFMIKKIAKKNGLYFLMLKSMRHYYISMYKQYWNLTKYEEDMLPGLEFIEKIIKES